MITYRVEHIEGRHGPYVRRDGRPRVVDDKPKSHQPMPWEDGTFGGFGPDINNHRFGFASLDRLSSWFNHEERAALHKHGYRVGVYHVPDADVRAGKYQLVFSLDTAKEIDVIELTEV